MDRRWLHATRISAIGLLGLGLLGGCGSEPTTEGATTAASKPPPGWTTYHDERRGYTVSFPSGWHRARTNLTPNLVDPREILTIATYPLRDSPSGRCFAPIDAPHPALDGLGPTDAIVSIQERRKTETGDHPPQTKPFRLPPLDLSYPEGSHSCLRGRVRSVAFHPFRVGERNFYAFAAFGRSASSQTRRNIRRVLERTRFDADYLPRWRASG